VCAQLRPNAEGLPGQESNLVEDALGIPAYEAQLALQTDACKELVNKISWVLGTTYRRNYSNMKTVARAEAWEIVKQIIRNHGYPDKIRK